MRSLADATAAVTGASRGIGLAVARALAVRGARVAMIARSREKLEEVAAEVGGVPFAVDLASAVQAQRLAEQVASQFGDAPDILVNAAGAFELAPAAETSVDSFDAMLAANLRAPFVMIHTFLPRMLARRSGYVVSIGSVAGRRPYPGNSAYSASKYGLRGLHEVLEVELKGSGVRTALIEPAATDTSIWDRIDHERTPGLPTREQMLTAEQVADCVLFVLERPERVAVKYMAIESS